MAATGGIRPKNTLAARTSDRSQKVFSEDLLWVNHNADHMKAAPNRHRVFTHIQRRYRPWKKKATLRPCKHMTTSPPARRSNKDDKYLLELVTIPPPTSLIAKGNSDAFSSMPIVIGPEENELIGFYRDYYLPAQYGNKKMHVQALMKKDWQDCMEGMLDEGIAHGSLARWGHMVNPGTGRHYTTAMKHQLKSIRSLQRKLAEGQSLQTYPNYMHLNMLFSAETLSRNVAGARVYARIFKKLFEEAWRQGTLDFTLLLYQVHNDVQTSAISLLPTVFDLDVFVPMAIEPLRNLCLADLPVVDADMVNATLSTTAVEPLFGYLKSLRLFWATLNELTNSPGGSSIHVATLRGFHDCVRLGQAVNRYVYFKEKLEQQLKRSERVDILAQVCLSLGAVWMAKSYTLDHRTLDYPLFDMRPVVMPALRENLQQLADLSTDADRDYFATARIWALYVGALNEHRWPAPKSAPYRWYFTARLVKEAREAGLATWAELLPVLQTFVFSHQIGPTGAIWFDALISQWDMMVATHTESDAYDVCRFEMFLDER